VFGIEPGPHCWEASTIGTTPFLLHCGWRGISWWKTFNVNVFSFLAEAIARMRRRSASSVRSSGRRRIDSARNHRYVECSLSACSGMSRPSSATGRSRLERVQSGTDRHVESREAFSQGEARGDTENAAVVFLPRRGEEIEEFRNTVEDLTSVHSEERGNTFILSDCRLICRVYLLFWCPLRHLLCVRTFLVVLTFKQTSLIQKKNLFYKETVVLCRWRSEVWKFSFKGGSNYHHKQPRSQGLSFPCPGHGARERTGKERTLGTRLLIVVIWASFDHKSCVCSVKPSSFALAKLEMSVSWSFCGDIFFIFLFYFLATQNKLQIEQKR